MSTKIDEAFLFIYVQYTNEMNRIQNQAKEEQKAGRSTEDVTVHQEIDSSSRPVIDDHFMMKMMSFNLDLRTPIPEDVIDFIIDAQNRYYEEHKLGKLTEDVTVHQEIDSNRDGQNLIRIAEGGT